jgi:hypothetical protein
VTAKHNEGTEEFIFVKSGESWIKFSSSTSIRYVLTDKGLETRIRRYEIIVIKRFRMEQREFAKCYQSSSGLITHTHTHTQCNIIKISK